MKKAVKPLAVSLFLLVFSSAFVATLSSSLHLAESTVLASSIPGTVVTAKTPGPEISGVQKQAPPPPKDQRIPPPVLTAVAALVEDLDTHDILFSKNPDKRLPIASTTKIMTALVASKHYSQEDILTVPPAATVSGSLMGIKVGEQLTFRSLLYGMLLNSGNDAAFALAGDYPGGVEAFVGAMNEEARKLNLQNTSFDNPAGFDSPNHYSSASDLAKITEIALENIQLSKVFDSKEMVVTSVDKTQVYYLKNLNILLGQNGVMGVKTGYTPDAKENFVGLVSRSGHRLLTVVLGSEDRFGETEKLMDWSYQNFIWP